MNRTRLTRPRLTQRIARAAEYPITILVAPAGFGKTVALADYLRTERVAHMRYDVRSDHNTLSEFVRGLANALESRLTPTIASFPEAQARAMAAGDAVLELARWMAEHLEANQTIVVDDLHNAAGDQESIAFLGNLIERTHQRVRWILAARSTLDLPVGSWIAYERMDQPIGEEELRFAFEEALAAAQDSQLDERGAQELLRLTGGWPVAFSIGLRSSAPLCDLQKLTDGTREMIYRYLAEQVYHRLDTDQRRFLLETSVYPWLDVAIIEQRGDSPAFLTQLRRDAGFIYAASQNEYRYHDLFRDFLERELRAQGTRVYQNALRAAASTLERLERTPEALALFTRAESVEDLVRLLESAGFELVERGRTDIIEAALHSIPEARRAESAVATGVEAILASRRGQAAIAETQYTLSIEHAKDPTTRAQLVYRYALDLVRAGLPRAIALLQAYEYHESLDESLQASIVATLATAHTKAGDATSAKRCIQRALLLAERSQNAIFRAKIYQQAAFVLFFSGEARQAEEYASGAIQLADQHGVYEIAARAYTVLHNISHDVDDDPISGLRHLEQLAVRARKSGSQQMQLYVLLGVYDIEAERGNEGVLARLDREIEALEMTLPQSVIETLLPARALRAAWDKNFARAYEVLRGSTPVHADRRALRWAEIAIYALANNARQSADEAMRASYAGLHPIAGPTPRALRTLLFLAIAELLRGKEVAAHRLIGDVERYIGSSMTRLRTLAQAVRALYNRVLDPESTVPFVAALERLRAQEMGGLARLLSVLPFTSGETQGLRTLTASERAILGALVSGASSKQIGAGTGRSPQTVDVHIRSICRKLGCSGRIEAIAIARDAGWFAAGV